MSEPYILSCESTVDLPYAYVTGRHIPVAFYTYAVNGTVYEDNMERDPEAERYFYEQIDNGNIPSTSQINYGTYYDFLENNRITLTCGMAFNKSCYNAYEHNFSVCNVELKYTYKAKFKNGWTLPLHAAYIYNPVFDKSYINFTANIALF